MQQLEFEFEDRNIEGPDVSFYQGDPADGLYVDFQKMKNDPRVHFVVIRAGQHKWKDSAFDYNWKEAKRVGLPRASYFFLDKDGDGKAQAEFYWNIMKADPGEGPLIVDFEDGSGDWDRLYAFLVRLTQLSGYPAERIWIYTGKYYWQDFGPKTQAEKLWFLRHPLWLAAYTLSLDPEDVPYPWIEPVMWQAGTTIVWGPDLGVHSLELDWNILNGGIEVFKRYFKTDYVPTEPNEGGNEMLTYRIIWPKGVARRAGPSTAFANKGLYTGIIDVDVIEDNIPDADDPTNVNKRWVKFADGLFGASAYPNASGVPSTRMVKVVLPPPDPEPTDPQIVHKIDVYDNGKIGVDNGDPF